MREISTHPFLIVRGKYMQTAYIQFFLIQHRATYLIQIQNYILHITSAREHKTAFKL